MKFLSDYSQTNEVKDTQLNSTADVGKVISAVALSENKVFIAYIYDYSVYGLVCTISGTTITKGTATKITTITYYASSKTVSVVALTENKVFIAYNYGSGNRLMGSICTITGTNITMNSDTDLTNTNNTGHVISAVKLDEEKVFITHSWSADSSLSGIVCTISGTTITAGTDTRLVSTQNTGSAISATAVSENKVLIAHKSVLSTATLGVSLVSINGTTITREVGKNMDSGNNTGSVVSATRLSQNKVFIAHTDNNNKLWGTICTISTNAVNIGTDIVLNSTGGTGKVISAIAFNENKVLVTHSDSNNYLYSISCDIDETKITKGDDIQLSSSTNSGSSISATVINGNVFVGHSYSFNNYLYGMIINYLGKLVKEITSTTEKIGGIAITSGQDGEMVTTVRPDDVLKMKLNATISTENFGNISWNDEIITIMKHNSNETYYSYKTLNIGGTDYKFSFCLFYGEGTTINNIGTIINCVFSPELYNSGSSKSTNRIKWASAFDNSTTRNSTLYTEANSDGEKITIDVFVEKIN